MIQNEEHISIIMKNSVYKRHINNYLKHWWFQARKNIIQEVIKKTFNKNLIILDFGSGSGVNVEMLSKFGMVNIYEPHLKTRKYLKVKYKNKIKFKILNKVGAKKFDLIILADVLEHIKKDKNQIKILEKNLNKNGCILITVPAHQFLFSSKDTILKHYRRYNIKEIKNLFKRFYTIKLTYFNFFLFFPIALTIIFCKKAGDIDDDIALAHNLAERQSCHDCHPPAATAPTCCHPQGGKPDHATHRPVFHGWQQQMRRAAKQHNCVKGKHIPSCQIRKLKKYFGWI